MVHSHPGEAVYSRREGREGREDREVAAYSRREGREDREVAAYSRWEEADQACASHRAAGA